MSYSPVFSYSPCFPAFKGSELLAMEGELSFKDRSLYVQSGFWELLVVAGMGYALWAMCKIAGCDLSPRVKLRSLLACFAAELLLIGIFSLHKIGTLQWVFGLKDSRLLATMVVCSVVSVFVFVSASSRLTIVFSLDCKSAFALDVFNDHSGGIR